MRWRSHARVRVDQRVGEVLAVLLAGVSAAGIGVLPGVTPGGTTLAAAAPRPSVDTPNLSIAVAPGTWTMMASTSAEFSAHVVGDPAGCSVSGLTTTWRLPGESGVVGFLNRSSGISVTYTTFSSEGGAFGELTVDASVILDCGGTESDAWASGGASLTILPTTTLDGPFVTPDPATPGAPVLVSWRLAGGLAPYRISVAFGDGSSAEVTQMSPGSDELVHRFPAGSFDPSVEATDSQGNTVTQSDAAPATVASGLVAIIGGAGPVVDAGRPFELTANASGGVPPYALYWKGAGAPAYGDTWTRVQATAGTFNATLEVIDLVGDVAETSVELTVVPSPAVTVTVPAAGCDVGVAFPVQLNVTGGTGPYRVAWNVAPGVSGSNATVPTAGRYLEPATATAPGGGWIEATVVDALGANGTSGVPVVGVHPLPRAEASAGAPDAETGRPVDVAAGVIGGTPPYRWSIIPSAEVDPSTAVAGLLANAGAFGWNGTPVSSGNLTVVVTVVDVNGVETEANATVRVLPSLRPALAIATADPSVGRAVTVGLLVGGGAPPYGYSWSTSDGQTGLGNASSAGPVDWTVTPGLAGYWQVRLSVTDALGVTVNATANALVASGGSVGTAAPAPAASGTSDWVWPVALLVVVGVAASAWVLRGRPPASAGASPEPPPGAEAMGIVRRLLEESGDLERDTLTFLAEDEGVAPDAALAAVERWRRAGKVENRAGDDGETIFRWTPASGPRAGDGGREEP